MISQQVGDATLTDVDIASANKDGASSTASMRTLGTGSAQAAAGNHTHTQWNKRVISAAFDGQGSAPAVNTTVYIQCPVAGTLVGWRINGCKASDLTAGSAVVDVWKIANGSAYPTVSNTIAASAKPTLSAVKINTDDTLTGWTTSITANDIFGFSIESSSTLTRLIVELIYNPS